MAVSHLQVVETLVKIKYNQPDEANYNWIYMYLTSEMTGRHIEKGRHSTIYW